MDSKTVKDNAKTLEEAGKRLVDIIRNEDAEEKERYQKRRIETLRNAMAWMSDVFEKMKRDYPGMRERDCMLALLAMAGRMAIDIRDLQSLMPELFKPVESAGRTRMIELE